jgi:hypothetical protein
MSIKKKAIILIVVAVVIGIAAVSSIFIMNTKTKKGSYAYIYHNNEVIKVVDLTNVKEDYEFKIEVDGGYNTIRVTKDGSIGVVDASCPDHICMNTGFIKNGLMPITCLPNKIVIEVKNSLNDGNSAYDSVAK